MLQFGASNPTRLCASFLYDCTNPQFFKEEENREKSSGSWINESKIQEFAEKKDNISVNGVFVIPASNREKGGTHIVSIAVPSPLDLSINRGSISMHR